MTREKAIRLLTTKRAQPSTDYQMAEVYTMAIKALSQVSEIEKNIIKYMKKYPNHVGNTDFWEGFYACRNVVLQLDDEEYAPKEQEPICDRDCEHCTWTECPIDPCDDTVSIRKDVLKCRVEKLVVYNVEWLKKHWQMEMERVCGVEPCDDAVSRGAIIEMAYDMSEIDGEHFTEPHMVVDVEDIQKLPSVTQKSGKWDASCTCSVCGQWRILESEKNSGKYKYCPNCGASMESEDKG